jgi:uncharacterized membrane protein
MNIKLIFQLSLFGLAMAIATVFWIPLNYEPFFWLIIFFICAYQIAKKCFEKYFLNGFLVSLVNCIWITAAHLILFHNYIIHHPRVAKMMMKMPMHRSPRLLMLVAGPIIGILSGILLGLFSFMASRMIRKKLEMIDK